MKFASTLLLLLFPVVSNASSGEKCTSGVDPQVITLLQQENAASCFVESFTGTSWQPIPYKQYTKAEIRGSDSRNAIISDFLDNNMVHFGTLADDHGYFWPYDDVKKKSSSSYYFYQSGNRSMKTEMKIKKVGHLKKLEISSPNYKLNLICADDKYFQTCANTAVVNDSARGTVKDVPAASGSAPAPTKSSSHQ